MLYTIKIVIAKKNKNQKQKPAYEPNLPRFPRTTLKGPVVAGVATHRFTDRRYVIGE